MTTMALREAIQRLSGYLDDRAGECWEGVEILPLAAGEVSDPSIHEVESARLRDEMLPYRLYPNMIPALCQVFSLVLGEAGHQTSEAMAKAYLATGINFLWAYAQQSRHLGHFEAVCEVFDHVQWSITEYKPKPTMMATLNPMGLFLGNNLEEMPPHRASRFFAHGAAYTHAHRDYAGMARLFLFHDDEVFRKQSSLRMNQGLAMLFVATVGDGTIRAQPKDLMPRGFMVNRVLELCEACIRLQDETKFPDLVHVDILLLAQTINVVSHIIKNSSAGNDRSTFEAGVEALLKMTLSPLEKKPTAGDSIFKPYGNVRVGFCSNDDYELLMKRLLACFKNTPKTDSKILSACALRLQRVVINDLALSGNRLAYFRDHGGRWLTQLVKVAKAGYRREADFDEMGNSARLFFVRNVADGPARTVLLKNDLKARVAGFNQDLGL
ncbi:hypothetical protein V0M98_35340 (plasmid) [Pseudomonas silesiensis]|uniref:hypothetical protein n=1 Tax=Pseudomonas silesiensis TaxID=1853130 RepID=UPI0030CF1FB2